MIQFRLCKPGSSICYYYQIFFFLVYQITDLLYVKLINNLKICGNTHRMTQHIELKIHQPLNRESLSKNVIYNLNVSFIIFFRNKRMYVIYQIYIYIYILKVVGFFYREMLIGVSKIFDNELFLETFYETEKVIDFFNSFFF